MNSFKKLCIISLVISITMLQWFLFDLPLPSDRFILLFMTAFGTAILSFVCCAVVLITDLLTQKAEKKMSPYKLFLIVTVVLSVLIIAPCIYAYTQVVNPVDVFLPFFVSSITFTACVILLIVDWILWRKAKKNQETV